jgi:hypothetical protein
VSRTHTHAKGLTSTTSRTEISFCFDTYAITKSSPVAKDYVGQWTEKGWRFVYWLLHKTFDEIPYGGPEYRRNYQR